MKTPAAVLYDMERPRPYAESRPLAVGEVDLEGPGPGEVLVEVAAAGLCHSDLSVINGSRPRPTPLVLGHEAAGIVRETGAGVRDLAPGDAVVFSFVPICGHCLPCMSGRAALCENGARSNVAGTLLNGGRRFRDREGRLLNHHQSVSGYSRFTVTTPDSLVKIDPDVQHFYPGDRPFERRALDGAGDPADPGVAREHRRPGLGNGVGFDPKPVVEEAVAHQVTSMAELRDLLADEGLL